MYYELLLVFGLLYFSIIFEGANVDAFDFLSIGDIFPETLRRIVNNNDLLENGKTVFTDVKDRLSAAYSTIPRVTNLSLSLLAVDKIKESCLSIETSKKAGSGFSILPNSFITINHLDRVDNMDITINGNSFKTEKIFTFISLSPDPVVLVVLQKSENYLSSTGYAVDMCLKEEKFLPQESSYYSIRQRNAEIFALTFQKYLGFDMLFTCYEATRGDSGSMILRSCNRTGEIFLNSVISRGNNEEVIATPLFCIEEGIAYASNH